MFPFLQTLECFGISHLHLIDEWRYLHRLPPMWVLASSRSSSSLGSSMMGLGGLSAVAAAVKLDVAPWWGPYSCTGELRISSRLGMGRLEIELR